MTIFLSRLWVSNPEPCLKIVDGLFAVERLTGRLAHWHWHAAATRPGPGHGAAA